MAVKKSELYSKIWSMCDELRGGMDASQYKDYVLTMLFIKYISDKYAGKYSEIVVPEGASFKDMVALKGDTEIGDKINKLIIEPIRNENNLSKFPDFNDAAKLGAGKEKVERLTNLIAIFEDPALDFSKNRAGDDDLLGDAYEYLMRHFATESGKSKGQFYTPAEVSKVLAKVIGIHDDDTSRHTTVYDPTCGSGSLLLKVADEAKTDVTIYGQEKDEQTSGLAKMNMILHDNPTATINQGNTLTNPAFLNNTKLKSFDYVVANPPFSDKRWKTGLTLNEKGNDEYNRFESFGTPPNKNGDYAYLLHIVKSLKSTGKGACILPHGVLFRGNAEEVIRKNLIKSGYIKSIIGLPSNLFYGTGIPACIVVIDKENADSRTGVFVIDASKGFMKDGPKNRLRSRDIHKIVDVFTNFKQIEKYSRMVPIEEIEENEFNLNIPRYIDNFDPEDKQSIDAHLNGGIPIEDINDLGEYWSVYPNLRSSLFKNKRSNYVQLKVELEDIREAILNSDDFIKFMDRMGETFKKWQDKQKPELLALDEGVNPKEFISDISEDLLYHYSNKPLVDKYSIYQLLMDYWDDIMQDDLYFISSEGWNIKLYKPDDKPKNSKYNTSDLLPRQIIINKYFLDDIEFISELESRKLKYEQGKEELEDEYGFEDGILNGLSSKEDIKLQYKDEITSLWEDQFNSEYRKFNKLTIEINKIEEKMSKYKKTPIMQSLKNKHNNITLKSIRNKLKEIYSSEDEKLLKKYLEMDKIKKKKLKENKLLFNTYEENLNKALYNDSDNSIYDDLRVIIRYQEIDNKISKLNRKIKDREKALNEKTLIKYPTLDEKEIKHLVIDNKWIKTLDEKITDQINKITYNLTQRIKELGERYAQTLPEINSEVDQLENKVDKHLKKMGYEWK